MSTIPELDVNARYWAAPHSYMNEIFASMDCHHWRFFDMPIGGTGTVLVCCACGHSSHGGWDGDDCLVAGFVSKAFE